MDRAPVSCPSCGVLALLLALSWTGLLSGRMTAVLGGIANRSQAGSRE
jgi:hypothetical protein